MKRVIMISVILFAGIALQAQTGGGPNTPDSFKGLRSMYDAIDMTKVVMPFNPMVPVIPVFTKQFGAQPAHKRLRGPRVAPGDEFMRISDSSQGIPFKY